MNRSTMRVCSKMMPKLLTSKQKELNNIANDAVLLNEVIIPGFLVWKLTTDRRGRSAPQPTMECNKILAVIKNVITSVGLLVSYRNHVLLQLL